MPTPPSGKHVDSQPFRNRCGDLRGCRQVDAHHQLQTHADVLALVEVPVVVRVLVACDPEAGLRQPRQERIVEEGAHVTQRIVAMDEAVEEVARRRTLHDFGNRQPAAVRTQHAANLGEHAVQMRLVVQAGQADDDINTASGQGQRVHGRQVAFQ